MECSPGNKAIRRFKTRCFISAALVVLFALVACASFRLLHLHGVVAYLVAILPALPILWAIWETGRYIKDEKDEFLRNVLVQCLLGGIGGCLGLTTVWGYLQDFDGIHPLDPIWVYPFFWLFVVLSYPVVKARYR
jgi:hypothetical protein